MENLRPLRDILAIALGSLAIVFILDASLFRTGFYTGLLAPASYAGRFRMAVRQAREAPRTAARPVLVLGNSVMGEGFSARVADGVAAGRVRFVNASVPGASIRSWFYLLRESDPRRNRYSVIVLPVEDYDDEDGDWDRDDYPEDIRIAAPVLRITDIPEFVGSYRKWDARLEALRGALLKGTVYRDDLRDFLRHPEARLAAVEAQDQHGAEWLYGYDGRHGNPDSSSQELQALLHRAPAPQTGRHKHYRAHWLGRLTAPYRGGDTRFLVIRAPRTPIPVPRYARYDAASSIRALRSQPDVVVEEERSFEFLEQPRYFFDALHLNAAGRRAFSDALARLVLNRFF